MNKLIVCSTFSLLFASAQVSAVNLKRTLRAVSEHELTVEIIVNKGNLNDFASLNERIPQGAELKYAKSVGGTFEIKDNSLKYVWTKLPQQETFSITYTVNTQNLKEGIYSINGKFSCLENGNIKVYEIESSGFVVNENSNVSPDEFSENMITETRIAQPVTSSAGLTKSTEVSKSTVPETSSVYYGLQLLSTKENLAPDYFSKKYNVNEKVKRYTADGLNKYVMGEFKTQDQAQHTREILIRNGCKDAFIVAYSNNQRISLDDAKRLAASR